MGTRFPHYSYEESLNQVRSIDDKFGSRVVSFKDVAKIFNINVIKGNNHFRAIISTAKQLGLIDSGEEKETIFITSEGNLILHPEDTDVEKLRKNKINSFLKCQVFSNLVNKYKNKRLPTEETLTNVLINKQITTNKQCRAIAKSFLNSIKELNLLDDKEGTLNIEGSKKDSFTVEDNNPESIEQVNLFSPITEQSVSKVNTSTSSASKIINPSPTNRVMSELDYNLSFAVGGSSFVLRFPSSILNDQKN